MVVGCAKTLRGLIVPTSPTGRSIAIHRVPGKAIAAQLYVCPTACVIALDISSSDLQACTVMAASHMLHAQNPLVAGAVASTQASDLHKAAYICTYMCYPATGEATIQDKTKRRSCFAQPAQWDLPLYPSEQFAT